MRLGIFQERKCRRLRPRLFRILVSKLFCFCLIGHLVAQNLVPNNSFEIFDHCPPYPGQIHESVAWDSPNNKTTDYFHTCSPMEDGASVPKNLLGVQAPATGQAYAGIRTWIPVIEGNPVYREYLGVTLIDELAASQKYLVQFKVSMAEASSHASGDFGIYFSKKLLPSLPLYAVEPQIKNPIDRIVEETEGWVNVVDTFTAVGGETFLVLGNFKGDVEMTRQLVSPQDDPKVYYYVDDVVVEACVVPEETTFLTDTTFCEGYALAIEGPENAFSYRWSDGVTDADRVIDQPGYYQLTSDFVCYQEILEIYVEEVSCDCSVGIPVLGVDVSSPVKDWFQAEGGNGIAEIEWIRFYDVSGRLVTTVFSEKAQEASFLSGLPAGIYFYQIKYRCERPDGTFDQKVEAGKWLFMH